MPIEEPLGALNESVYMAPALNARGITVVAPDYTLALSSRRDRPAPVPA